MGFFTAVVMKLRFSPFGYALVRTDDRCFNVNGVIPHSSQLQRLIKRADHV